MVGAARLWRVYPVSPARRDVTKLSNVSAIVLPGPVPVVNPEQLPMFSEHDRPWVEPQVVKDLLEVVRIQARTIHEVTAVNREMVHNALDHARARSSDPEPEPETEFTLHGYGPSNPRWHPWRAFVLDLQRQVQELPAEVVRLTKIAVATHGSDTVETISYAMRGYGLDVRKFDPLAWNPDENRVWVSPKKPIHADTRRHF